MAPDAPGCHRMPLGRSPSAPPNEPRRPPKGRRRLRNKLAGRRQRAAEVAGEAPGPAAEEIFRPLAMRRLNLRIGKDVLLLIEDTLEVAKQTFAIGGVVRLRGLMLSLPGCAQRGLSQN